ncbi:3-methyladenine DNA glycosylase, partial [candidate division GN15 bacterium]|nr:3-methyladenine DNA glycosylase [candidate division GN15 bacterium]
LRAAEPVEGIAEMRATAPKLSDTQLLAGPGKFCRAFRLTLEQNGWDLTDSRLYLEDRGERPKRIARSPRIGISKATERKWRFCDPDSLSVSKRPAGRIRNGAASARDSR